MKNYQTQDTSLQSIENQFDKAVRTRRFSMFNERIVPIITLPIMTGGAAWSSLLTLWDHLPPQTQQIGLIAAGGITAAATAYSLVHSFTNASAKPLVSRESAIEAIDKDISGSEKPASVINRKILPSSSEANISIFEHKKKKEWERSGAAITDQKLKTGLGPYYKDQNAKAGLHASIVLATALSTYAYGDGAFTRFQEAWSWEPPLPPIVYQAWITPPDNVDIARGYLPTMLEEAIANGTVLTVHEGSQLFIVADDRPATITLNGQIIEPEKRPDLPGTKNKSSYNYTIDFGKDFDDATVNIEGQSLNLNIQMDYAPQVQIIGNIINPDNPNEIELEYKMNDDFGVSAADIELGLKNQDGKFKRSLLPSAQLPPIDIPFSHNLD